MCHTKIRGKNVLELHLSERYLRKFEIASCASQCDWIQFIHGGPVIKLMGHSTFPSKCI